MTSNCFRQYITRKFLMLSNKLSPLEFDIFAGLGIPEFHVLRVTENTINVTWSPGLTYGAKTVHYVEYRKDGMYKCYMVTWTDLRCKNCPLCRIQKRRYA